MMEMESGPAVVVEEEVVGKEEGRERESHGERMGGCLRRLVPQERIHERVVEQTMAFAFLPVKEEIVEVAEEVKKFVPHERVQQQTCVDNSVVAHSDYAKDGILNLVVAPLQPVRVRLGTRILEVRVSFQSARSQLPCG